MFVFHIGLPKTGSSTVQAFLAENREALARRGVLYPRIGAHPLAQYDLTRSLRDGAGTASPAWDELRALRPVARERTVAISSEEFAGCDPVAVRDGIGGDDARVLVYIRDPQRRIVSAYSQLAKRGKSTLGFDDYYARHALRISDLSSLILPWAETFGRERVRVRLVEPSDLVAGRLVDDVLAALGTTPEGLVAPANSNEMPDWRVVELLRERHARHQERSGEAWTMRAREPARIAALGLAAGARLGWAAKADYLTADQKRSLATRFRQEREALLAALPDCRITDLTLDETTERPFVPGPEAVAAEDRRAFDEAMAAVGEELAAAGLDFRGQPTRTAAPKATAAAPGRPAL